MGFYPDAFPDLGLNMFLPDSFFFAISLIVAIVLLLRDYVTMIIEVGKFQSVK